MGTGWRRDVLRPPGERLESNGTDTANTAVAVEALLHTPSKSGSWQRSTNTRAFTKTGSAAGVPAARRAWSTYRVLERIDSVITREFLTRRISGFGLFHSPLPLRGLAACGTGLLARPFSV